MSGKKKRLTIAAILMTVAVGGFAVYQSTMRRPGTASDWELLEAARKGDVDGAQRALSNGADVNFRMQLSGYEQMSGQEPPYDVQFTALHYAVEKGSLPITKLLIEHKADVNARNSFGNTPLLMAINFSHKEIVLYLLAHGADAKAKNKDGTGAVAFAQKRNMKPINEDILQAVKDAGAKK